VRCAVAIALVVAQAGCNAGGLRHHSTRNAPGNVVALDQPMPGERGDPAAYVPPTDPGENLLGVAPGAWIHFGSGRVPPEGVDAVSIEAGVQVQLAFGERSETGDKGAIGFPLNSWGATLGWAFVQSNGDLPAAIGPVFAEATRTWYLVQAAAGIAVYPTPGEVVGGRADGVDVGAQLTLTAAIFSVRLRYVQDSGFEAFAGYQLVLPSSVSWSR
jgi:hypothetical protein